VTVKSTMSARALIPWGLGLAAVAMVGVFVLPTLRLDPVPVSSVAEPSMTVDPPETLPESVAQDTGEPRFDLVRMESDGTTLVAGQAQPRSKVSVVVDGVTRAHADTDATGQFVVFVVLEISMEPRVMWLVQHGDGGKLLSSADTVILAPDGIVQSGPAAGEGAEPQAPLKSKGNFHRFWIGSGGVSADVPYTVHAVNARVRRAV
jgi:hypothetical protein